MKDKFYRFMAGRYGNDQFNKFLSITSLVLALAAILLRRSTVIAELLWILAFAGIVISYIRLFSRNMSRRREENAKYLRTRYKVTSFFRLRKEKWTQRKDYKFFTCPACHTTLRVPKGKGKISIVCRKCGNSFSGRT